MSTWKTVKLSDIGEIVGGATPPTSREEYYNGDIPWLTPKDLAGYHDRYVSSGERNITKEGLDACSAKVMPQGTVLFSSRAPIGYVAIAKNEICTNQGFKSIIPNSDIDSLFLYYLLIYNKDKIASFGSGTTFKEVSAATMKNIEVDVPNLQTQHIVASILGSFDKKIECNQKLLDKLQQQAIALFESWFVNYDPWNGIQPSNWENVTLGTLVVIKRGGSPRPIQDYLSNTGLRWLKISDVSSLNSPFVLRTKEYIKEDGLPKTVYLKAGELVLSNSATPGIPKILDVDSCIHDGWLYFPKSELSTYYLYLFFKHIREQLVTLGNGSVFTNLKTDILKAYPTTKADAKTRAAFDSLVAPLFSGMLNLDRENARLITLRDTLLSKLMSGEIDVSKY